MKDEDFVHLHVHSDHSHVDGAAKTAALAKAAKDEGHVALALTDHGTVSGNIEHWKACDKQGIKPLLGCEAYLAPGLDDNAHLRRGLDEDGTARRDAKGRKKSFDYNHFTLIAKNKAGWLNLQQLATIASLEGFYYRPRMSWSLLKKHSEGLIALSGCLSGEISDEVKKGSYDKAEASARRWKDLFGDDYYMELMPADDVGCGDGNQAKLNDACLAIARKIGSKIVATSDVHYIHPEDAALQELKICVNAHKTIEDNRKTGLNMGPTYYYKSTEEMYRAFSHYPEALKTTREIADKCEKIQISPGKGKYYLPKFVPPNGSTALEYFRTLSRFGLIKRYGGCPTWAQWQRLEYEIQAIEKVGFVDYLLVVSDFMTWARNNGVPTGTGRGSAAGSLVVYCLGITNIDPLRYDLMFERFINTSRVSMPDIDLDFCERGRGRVIEYVRQKYGPDCVAQIATFNTMKAKSAIRAVGKTLGIESVFVNRVAKLIPEGPKVDLQKCIDTIPELINDYRSSPQIRQLLDMSLKMVGLYRGVGRHAAGVVISDVPLTQRIALYQIRNNTHEDQESKGAIVTAFSMEQVEDVGLLKMDFLGLATITQIHDTLEMIEETTGVKIDPDTIPRRDSKNMDTTVGEYACSVHGVAFEVCRCCDKTLEIYRRAEVNGVFQVESGGMRKLLKDMKPDRFDDIIAIMALYRPGPLGSGMHETYVRRKNGEEEVVYEHPALKSITEKTYGVWCYQEQVMQLSVALAGFTMPEADELRKATAKKKPEEMEKVKAKFIPGCLKHSGLTEAQVTAIWDKIVFFSQYAFNCLAGDSEIVCADTGEVVTIKSLAESKRRPLVHALGDDFKVRARLVKRVWSTGKQEVFELETASHRKVKATAKHRFRTLEGWKELQELRPGDMIAEAREMETHGSLKMKHHEIVDAVAVALPHDKELNIAGRDVFWDTVKSITPAGVQDTYDLEVEHDHNFALSNGIIAHNCSHSAAYGAISWITAWLKANYPVEFLAATMTINAGGTSLQTYVDEAKRYGIEIEFPDVNKSRERFFVRVKPGGVRSIVYGLCGIKSVGTTITDIVAARNKVGRFTSLDHFCQSHPAGTLDSKVMTQLARAGAFDSLGYSRAWLLTSVQYVQKKKVVDESPLDIALRLAKAEHDLRAKGQTSLFEAVETDDKPLASDRIPDWSLKQLLDEEREAIGFYLSAHPLDQHMEDLTRYARDVNPGAGVMDGRVGGMVISVRKHLDKTGKEMAFVSYEAVTGSMDVVAFASVWAKIHENVKAGVVGFFVGEIDAERSPPQIKAKAFITIEEARTGGLDEMPRLLTIDIYDDDEGADRALIETRAYLDSINTSSGVKVAVMHKARADSSVKPRKIILRCRVPFEREVLDEVRARLGSAGDARFVK